MEERDPTRRRFVGAAPSSGETAGAGERPPLGREARRIGVAVGPDGVPG